MQDYAEAYCEFSLATFERRVFGRPAAEGLNACELCCDRWAGNDDVALEFVAKDFARETVTFAELKRSSSRFANWLKAQGIGKGDVVAGLLPRVPELFTVILGVWRIGAVYQPLFTAFGPAAIESRVTSKTGSQAKLIVTDVANAPKLADVPNAPRHLLIDRGQPGATAFAETLAAQSDVSTPVTLTPEDPFIILFTSGTTGSSKGVRHSLRMLAGAAAYMIFAVDLQPGDRYWNVADPGWAYGLYYAVFGPLLLGHTTSSFEGGFTVEAAVRVMKTLGITSLAAAPTAYRAMMAAESATLAPIIGQLRLASSAGEPLNPEVVRWGANVLHCPIGDHYGQTEIGMVVNNHHAFAHAKKEASAGVAMPGFDLVILDDALQPVPDGVAGVLAVRMATSPLMTFRGYYGAPTPQLTDDYYVTGDTMQRDADGCFFFTGRNDDIITSAGYRIGPFDVESVLIEHPAVAEVAVVGKPDPERTEIVKAFIVLRKDRQASDALAAELRDHVRKRLSLHAYPREVEFLAELPKTPSGKVQRFLLRRRD